MKLKVQAQHLQPGDIVGSGEIVSSVRIGAKTPKGKCEVILCKVKDGALRMSFLG